MNVYSFICLMFIANLLHICLHVKKKKKIPGVPVRAQWLTSPTTIRENTGSTPGLAQ